MKDRLAFTATIAAMPFVVAAIGLAHLLPPRSGVKRRALSALDRALTWLIVG